LGVWTNKDQDQAQALIEDFFPGAFLKVTGAVAHRPLKPEPQAGLELASFLGAWPSTLYYLGDSEIDLQTAQACGFMGLAVSWGFRSPESLRQAGAKIILDKPEDFYSILENSHG
jgi:phosphoglycolate phosphatase